ncbi:STING domain-containing protein [Flavobacterium sp. SM2513]|uniref:STING domain-containing protein n=1 Tax=Flavobacterium sp. SM2513 TaxID=3424766 RepID=UPI003D7F4191
MAYGYFNNFVERTVQPLLEDKADEKVFHLTNGKDFTILDLKFTLLLPNDLSDYMFKKSCCKAS